SAGPSGGRILPLPPLTSCPPVATRSPTDPPMSPLDTQLQNALAQNPFLTGRKLRIEMNEGRLTLHGTVNSYYHKQMAQESLRHLAGVSEIENRLEVSWA